MHEGSQARRTAGRSLKSIEAIFPDPNRNSVSNRNACKLQKTKDRSYF